MSYSLKHLIQFEPSNLSAFGTLEADPLTPVVQLDFVYGINTQTGVSTTANSATVDTSSGRLRLQSGTNTAGSAMFNSRRIVKYSPGQGITARFTVAFTTGVADNTQIVGCGNTVDGYFFGYNGTSFGILHRNGSSDSWVAQSSWNGDKANGTGASAFTINPTYGNVFMIKYPYLGYGDINFFVQDSTTGRFLLVHTIRYANTTATVQLSIPNLFFFARSLNAGASTNQIIYVGSVGIFLSGQRNFVSSPQWAIDNSKSGITTETCIINLKNATTYNGSSNRSLIRLGSISLACTAAASTVVVVRFKLGVTIGGAPSYTTISGTTADSGTTITSGNSIASYDTAGTTVTSGTYIFNLSSSAGNNGSGGATLSLIPFELFVAPGEILTISGASASSATIGVSLNWTEDI